MMHITEDTPPDMLAGAMDLTVHLPSGRSVKMSVERSTPMMDLLVQITTTHHLQLSGYIIQALGMAPTAEHSDKILPYKPSTPIGALDTQHIKVVPKGRTLPVSKNNAPLGRQPFESTFRLKVHLPRNQLYVCRVSRNVHLEDILNKVCDDKNLDPMKYEFRHPGNLNEVLDPKLTLNDYQITEVHIVSKGTVSLTQAFSSSDIMALRKEEERKQMQAKTGGGVFNLIFKRGKNSMGSGSLSSENRSISPTHSDDSRSVTPPAIQQTILPPPVQKNPPPERPKPPQRKRRPAPKPPQQATLQAHETSTEKTPSQISTDFNNAADEKEAKTTENGLTICHSRNSSDSSGYHEASVLSDNCTTLPRRPKSTLINDLHENKLSGEHSKSTGNLSKFKSTSSLALAGRKKKAAPPPPPVLKTSNSVTDVSKPSPVVASQTIEEQIVEKQEIESDILLEKIEHEPAPQTPPTREDVVKKLVEPPSFEKTAQIPPPELHKKDDSLSTIFTTQSPRESTTSTQPPSCPPSPPPPPLCIQDKTMGLEIASQEEKIVEIDQFSSTDVNDSGVDVSSELKVDADLDIDWQYPLPSPPKAFRDSSPSNVIATNAVNYEIRTVEDSVVTSPELFEKVKQVEDNQFEEVSSDITSVISEEERQLMCNKLTLENLEKRKSLVYNRELATSLKYSEESPEMLTNKHVNVLNELENVIQSNPKPAAATLSRHNSRAQEPTVVHPAIDSTLPNFKITTYDNPKKKINIFEDDSISSNVEAVSGNKTSKPNAPEQPKRLQKQPFGNSMENISQPQRNGFDAQSDDFKKPLEYPKYKMNGFKSNHRMWAGEDQSSVTRSGSFSSDHNQSLMNSWKPSNPVKRSKSQIALNNKYNKDETNKIYDDEDSLSKSNSLYDLQSLGVIRMIQTKLNTPNSSSEKLDQTGVKEDHLLIRNNSQQETVKPQQLQQPVKPVVINRGPPAINLSTWSERPKTNVSLKEDSDYKINNSNGTRESLSSKGTTNSDNNIFKINSQSFDEHSYTDHQERYISNNVSIKINGAEPIPSNKSGNLIIKIGASGDSDFRRPFTNVNKTEMRARPHSIAFDSNFDISRVPIVRSVELKKPYKDNQNKSITQINSTANVAENDRHSPNRNGPVSFSSFSENRNGSNKYSDTYRSSEAINSSDNNNATKANVYVTGDSSSKPVIRVNSFMQTTPIVRGFQNTTNPLNRKSWTPVNSYATLPNKPQMINKGEKEDSYITNKNVPFSQSVLKRAESNKNLGMSNNSSNNNKLFGNIVLRNTQHDRKCNTDYRNSFHTYPSNNNNEKIETAQPPPPPQMPKNCNFQKRTFEIDSNPRDKMLSEIRNFGGKKGLKSVKA